MRWALTVYFGLIGLILQVGGEVTVLPQKTVIQEKYDPMARLKKMVGIPDSANFQDHRYCTVKWEKRVKFVLDSLEKNIQRRRKIKRDSLILVGIDPY